MDKIINILLPFTKTEGQTFPVGSNPSQNLPFVKSLKKYRALLNLETIELKANLKGNKLTEQDKLWAMCVKHCIEAMLQEQRRLGWTSF